MFGIILLPWWCWCVVMDALFSPFTVEMVDYSTPVHLLEVFLFFISWPPKLRIPDIMICEQGFVFVAFLDITWIMDKCGQCGLVATLRLQTLKKPWYWGQIMVVDRFIRPCCLCWCWVVLFHLFFFWFLIYFLDAILKSVDIWMQNMWHTFCGLFAI